MKMSNMKLKKIFSACMIATGTLGVLTISSTAGAATGWPVVNMLDYKFYPAYFGTAGIFTNAMAQQNSAVKGAIDTVRSVEELRIKQAESHQNDSDVRLRMALGQADIAKRDYDQMPTLAQCAEISRGAAMGGAAIGGSEKGVGLVAGGGGGNGQSGTGANSYPNRSFITDPVVNQSVKLAQRAASGTCTPEMAGIGNCPGGVMNGPDKKTNAAQNWIDARNSPTKANEFMGADIFTYGILGNSSGLEKVDKQGDYANYSMKNDTYLNVARKYIADATVGNAPVIISSDEAKKKNPLFFNKYYDVMRKLNAAYDTLDSIAKLRVGAPSADFASNTVSKSILEKFNEKYELIFPHLKKPTEVAPSWYELVRFSVNNDMFYEEIPKGDQSAYQEATLQRQAMTNMLLLKSVENQERTNILLSHMLIQLVSPVNVADVSREAAASNVQTSSK